MINLIATNPSLITNAIAIVRTLQAANYIAYFAGGCVRDALLGRKLKDVDIATSATPDEVAALFPAQSIGVGKSFGVMLVVVEGVSYDIATFRTDGGYQDGRHPDSIAFCSAEHDAQRRDFTINALFYDPVKDALIDYVGGQVDLANKRLRAIGNPIERFREDRLRMLRAIRFSFTCGMAIESETWKAILQEAPAITCVSVERIRTEFVRTLCETQHPTQALEALYGSGLLIQFFPELCQLRNCLQDPIWHPEGDVWMHTARMLELTPSPRSEAIVWAVLLHDIAKPTTLKVATKPDGSPWYRTPGHAAVGGPIADRILRRFKVPNALREQVITAVYYHMQFMEIPKMKKSTLRTVLGRSTIQLELELHRVDCLSSHAKLDLYDMAQRALEQYAHEPILPKPLISGKDLIAQGIQPGKAMGKLLKSLYKLQLEGATRETLLAECQQSMK